MTEFPGTDGGQTAGEVTGLTAVAEQVVAARPERVWDLVADVTRVGGWSPECIRAAWLGEPGRPQPGARFTGHNRFPNGFEYEVICVVTEADRPRAFAWVVLDDSGDPARPSSSWRYRIDPLPGGGSRVRQRFTHGPGASYLKGVEMTDIQIQTQYSTGVSRQAIEQALVSAGKDLGHLRPADLALLEDFHTMGRIATTQLADLVEITPDDEVLDAGSGIGGTARYVAERSRCHVAAVDLTEEYCATARWLNQLAGLDDRIYVRRADVTDLPFEDATFTLMFSQHVQMNVADKALLYAEARRVLAADGRLALWDIVAGEDGEPDFPMPWADRPEYSHLTTPGRLRTAIETSGFEIEQWNDLTAQAAATMQTLLTLPPSPIGLQAFVPNFESKARNLTAALADGRLRAIQGIARAI